MTSINHTPTPKHIQDLSGLVFSRLTVQSFSHTDGESSFWICLCVCGNTKTVKRGSLIQGNTTSCGCRGKETLLLRTTHGESSRIAESKEYRTWQGMISRCSRTTGKMARRYLERGIVICERWRGSFAAFLEDMGRAPSEKHTLDRINNDGNYEPGNCRWATMKTQARNSSMNRLIEIDGVVKTLVEWSEFSNVKYNTILYRLKRGWTEREAIFWAKQRGVKGPRK